MSNTKMSMDELKAAYKSEKGTPAEEGTISIQHIKILDSNLEERLDKNDQPFGVLKVDFRDLGFDSVSSKTFTSFQWAIFAAVYELDSGSEYFVYRRKGEKYWDWITVGTNKDEVREAGDDLVAQ